MRPLQHGTFSYLNAIPSSHSTKLAIIPNIQFIIIFLIMSLCSWLVVAVGFGYFYILSALCCRLRSIGPLFTQYYGFKTQPGCSVNMELLYLLHGSLWSIPYLWPLHSSREGHPSAPSSPPAKDAAVTSSALYSYGSSENFSGLYT